MTDEQLAFLLQKEEDERERDRAPEFQPNDVPGGISDEALARWLQAQEEEEEQAALAEQRATPFGPRTPYRAERSSLTGSPTPNVGSIIPPVVLSALGCGAGVDSRAGAVSGCLIGCQLALCAGLGHLSVCVCSICGAAAGYSASGAVPRVPRRFRSRTHNGESSDEDEDEDEPMRQIGLQPREIDGHTVDHVFQATPDNVAAENTRGNSDYNCMICMEAFAQGDALRVLPCMHRYHLPCINEWLARSPDCPICKRDVTIAPLLAETLQSDAPSRRMSRTRALGAWVARRAGRAVRRRG